MSEDLNVDPEAKFRQEHDVGPDLLDEELYYDQKVRAIKDGSKVWVVRNFDADIGRIYDLFYMGEQLGMVEDAGNRNDYRVYVRIQGETEFRAISDPPTLWDAVQTAEIQFDLDKID